MSVRPAFADLRDWLLDPAEPAVRAATLVRFLGRDADDRQVRAARRAALRVNPIASILAAQDQAGWWVKPGPGYAPKYTGTVWQLIFLDQLGADPRDARIQRACDYVMRWCPTPDGALGASGVGTERRPPRSGAIHCLNGNLVRALIGFGHLDDPAVAAAVEWAAAAITGAPGVTFLASATCGPGFACSANDRLPCAWGAVKQMLALARVPPDRRTPAVAAAVDAGVTFLLSRDPAVADYPMGWGNTRPNASWFRLGFPSGYVTDILQTLEALCELGQGRDPRLEHAHEWLLEQRHRDGTWHNRYAYNGKTTVPIERQGAASTWVTLRALTVLAAMGDPDALAVAG